MKRSILILGLLIINATVFSRTTIISNSLSLKFSTPHIVTTGLLSMAPPSITPSLSFSISENSSVGADVGTVTATDPDGTTTFQDWTITTNTDPNGNGTDAFSINSSTGEITVIDETDLDYESNTSLTISITVSDGTETSSPETVTIIITDINDNEPVINSGQVFYIDENITNGSYIGTLSASDSDTGTSFSNWSITSNSDSDGDGNDAFTIDPSSGQITVNDSDDLDYEKNTSISLQVTVSDGTNTSSSETVTINLNNLNDNTPVITASQTFTIDENLANNSEIGTVLATDGDAGTTVLQNWTITSNYNNDGDGNDAFTIDPSTGKISVNDSDDLNYENATSISLQVTVSDGTNTSSSETVTINLNNLNEFIPIVSASQTFTIPENLTNNSVVGTVIATDGDSETTLSGWTITINVNENNNGENAFIIDPSTGEIKVNDSGDLDYEKTKTLSISVNVTDGEKQSGSVPLVINLTDENDNTPIITEGQIFSINENVSDGHVVGIPETSDADDGTTLQSWSIVEGNVDNDNDGNYAFTIDPSSGQITVNDAGDIDYETNKTHNLQLSVSDGINTSSAKYVTLNITDVNDSAPVITAGQVFSVNENATIGTLVGTAQATDSDAVTTLQNWTISTNIDPNNNGTAAFAINPSSGQITVNDVADLDYETNTSLNIQVTVSDGANTSNAESVTININDLNDVAPVITEGQVLNINENSTNGNTIGSVTATDVDSDPTLFQNWTISSNIDPDGDENNAFIIDPSTGVISVNDVSDLDHETNETLTIQLTVSDGVNLSSPTSVTININDVNDIKPVITSGQTFAINETAPTGSVIGSVLATDADGTPTTFQNWTIITNSNYNGDGNLAFSINPTTGELAVEDTGDINYESNQSLTIELTVSDGVNVSDTVPVTINITNVNDITPVINFGQTLTIAENSANGTSVGTITATDGDSGTVFQNWTITNNIDNDEDGNNAFAINTTSGEITVADSNELDYETNTSFIISVTVSDGEHTSNEEQVTINLNDANDLKPIITPGQSFTINENTTNTTTIGSVVATDPDSTPTTFQNWTIRVNADTDGDGNNAFSINAGNGEISINDSGDIDYEKTKGYTLKITVSDGVNTSDTTDIIINLNDINDIAPVITPSQKFSIDENLTNDIIIGTIIATDADSTATTFNNWLITVNVDPDEDGINAFAIDSLTGVLRVNDTDDLDYEKDTIFTISVTVSDSVNTSNPEEVIINLNDLNDVIPVITADQIFVINENLAKDSLVGTVIATDGDITSTIFQNWEIVINVDPNNNGELAFSIDTSGNIIVNDSLDLNYEQDTTFTIKVTVSDGVNTSDTTDIVINLLDLNDILPIVTPNQIFSIDENALGGTLVDTIVATDADATPTLFSKWTISTNIDPNANDTLAFEIDSITGILTVKDSSDFNYEENRDLSIYVTVFDGENTSLPEKITINLKDLNDVAPVITPDQNFTIQENTAKGTLLGTLVATDGDITPTTFNQWTISTNSDADNDGNGAFALDTLTGELTVNDVGDIDYEKNMDITIEVTVSDSVNTSLPQKIIIHLTDLNDVLPEITKGQNFIVSEDVENAVSVGIVEATDGDITPTTFSNWTISTNVDPDHDGIMTFAINPENGEIFVNDADEIDFENDSKFYIAITVFDGVNISIPRVVTIYIDNLEDETPVITPGQVFYLNEDAVRRTLIGVPEAKDRDAGIVILQNWTILNNPDSDGDGRPAFNIDDETGEITVNDTDDIDYEANNKIELEITVSDGTNTSLTEIVTIQINRVLGVADEAQIEFSIFPNPVTDYATLKTKIQGLLLIINDKGQQIKQMNITKYETPINVQNFKTGIYYFVFRAKKSSISKKIIVK